MFHYAIKLNNKRQYILIAFHYAAERDTFAKNNANFNAIDAKQVRMYIDSNIIRKCNCYIRTAFDHNGVCRGKANSLYRPLENQRIDRPEDTPIPCAPIAKRKNIINRTSAHSYKQ